MATSFPSGLDSFANPDSTDPLDSVTVPHADQHSNANDAIEAIEAELGTDPAGGSATVAARFGVIEANDWVTSARIAAGAVDTDEIADDAVTAAKIADGEVGSDALADGSITEAKLATGSVTAGKIGSSQVTAAKIADGVVGTAKLADNSVTQAKIGPHAVGNEEIDWGIDPDKVRHGSLLRPGAEPAAAAESLLKEAVWWIDAAHPSAATPALSNLGWGGSALDARKGSTESGLEVRPDDGYIYLPGVSGNYLSVPDAALDITGDIDIRCKVALDDWTPGATQILVSKYASTGYSYQLSILTTGYLRLHWYDSGASSKSKDSTAAVSAFADGSGGWLRVVLDVDNDASGHDVLFYTSSDDGATWDQVGATVTTAGTTSVQSANSNLTVGVQSNGSTSPATGSFYAAQVFDGIADDGGTLALDIDCADAVVGASTFTAATGQTVTINDTSADSGDPKFLDHDGTNYVWLSGVAGNYLSVPEDGVTPWPTSDLSLIVRVAMDDWTPSAISRLMSKRSGSTDHSWRFNLNADGTLALIWTADGSTTITATSTVATGIADGETAWVKVSLDCDNGASGNDVSFWKSADGESWTQIGATVTTAGTTSVYDSTSLVSIGAETTAAPCAGKFYRAQIIADPFGTPTTVLDVDTSVITSGSATSFTARTGQQVAINRSSSGRKAVACVAPVLLLGSDDYLESPDSDLYDFAADESFTVVGVFREWAYQNAVGYVMKADGVAVGNTGWSLRGTSGGTSFNVSDGSNFMQAAAVTSLGASRTLVGVRSVDADRVFLYENSLPISSLADTTTGSLSNALALRVGRYSGSASGYAAMEFFGAAVFRRALTADEIATLTDYYTARTEPASTTDLATRLDAVEAALPTSGSLLRVLPDTVPAGERLLREAVWWLDAQAPGASGTVVPNLGWGAGMDAVNYGATFLDWTGDNYVYLPGVATNQMYVNDSAALDVVADIDLRVKCALADYTPTAVSTVIAKWGSGSQKSYHLRVNTDGTMGLYWTTDGSTSASATSTAATGLTDGSTAWLRATLDVDNGAGGYDVKFYTSTNDGETWNQVGSTVTGGSTTSIFAGTEVVRIGTVDGANHMVTGPMYRAQVLSGIDGTLVLDVDTSLVSSGAATSFPARTGQTVTVGRASSGKKTTCVVAPCWSLGTDDYLTVADNDLLDMDGSQDFTLVGVVRQWATSVSNGRWLSKRTSGGGGYVLSANGTTFTFNPEGDGSDAATFSYGACLVVAGTRDAGNENTAWVNGVSSGSPNTSAGVDLSNALNLYIGREAAGGSFQDFEFYAAAVFRRALSESEIGVLSDYFAARIV